MDFERIIEIKPYKANIARYFLIVVMLVNLGAGAVSFIFGDNGNLIGTVLAFIIAALTLYISRLDNFRFAVNVVAVLIPILFVTYNLTFNFTNLSTYIWLITIPVFMLVLLNINLGVTLSLSVLGFALLSYYTKLNDAAASAVSLDVFSHFVIVYLFVLVVLSISEAHQRHDEGVLKQQINHDFLTEILNRRGILHELDKNIKYASRYDSLLSVVLIDIDNFKNLNDQYGHDVGDHVLKYFAHLLKLNIRESDYVGRFGGEEFLILVPGLPKEAAELFAEKLRKLTNDYVQITGANITASFGVTQYKIGDSQETLLKRADMAMYSAKTVKNAVRTI
jgi:diguanylate cyclase (GGDEF)-like protein